MMSATTRKISEIAFSRKGKKPKRLEQQLFDGAVPYLDIKAFEQAIVRQYADSDSSTLAAADDILVVWDGARSGLSGIGHTGALGSTIAALTLREGYPRYVFHFIQSKYALINSQHKGTGIPHVDPEVFWNLELRFPSIQEQRRIAGRLDHIAAHLDNTRSRLEAIPPILKRFRMSVLAAACSGGLSKTGNSLGDNSNLCPDSDLPAGWSWKRFGDLIVSIRTGTTAVPQVEPTDWPVLRSSSIRPMAANFEDVRYLSESQSSNSKNYVAKNDLLFTRLNGSLEYVGNCGWVRQQPKNGIQYPDRLFCAKLSNPELAEYVEIAFSSPIARKQLEAKAKSSAGHQRISTDALTETLIPCPPEDERQEIIDTTQTLLAQAEAIEARYRKAKSFTDKLMPAVLAKAFRGELIEQGEEEIRHD